MGSIGRGTFGGARQALMQSEADRNLQTQLAKIGYQGDQDAFTQAQQQFERDRAAGMTAEERTLQAEMDRRKLQQQGDQFGAGYTKRYWPCRVTSSDGRSRATSYNWSSRSSG